MTASFLAAKLQGGAKSALLQQTKTNNWVTEKTVPFNCPYCKKICFAVKNFEFNLLEIIDDFSDNPSFHSCQFVWQDFLQTRPLNMIFKLTPDLVGLPEGYKCPSSSRQIVAENRALLWQETGHQTWQLLYDNGALLEVKAKKFSPFRRGVMLDWPKSHSGLRVSSKPNFSQHMFIRSPQERHQDFFAVKILLLASDARQLERQLVKMLEAFKAAWQQPLLIMPQATVFGDQILYSRSLTMLDDPEVARIFHDMVIPSWLKVEIKPERVKLKASFPFP